jgi:hypothetical protein
MWLDAAEQTKSSERLAAPDFLSERLRGSFTKRYCDNFPSVTRLLSFKLMGKG